MGARRTNPRAAQARSKSTMKKTTQRLSRSLKASRSMTPFQEEEGSERDYNDQRDGDTIEVYPLPATQPIVRIDRPGPGHEHFVETETAAGKKFKELPLEIHQEIVSYLSSDRDVATYAQLTKQMREAVSSSVWYRRFNERFDMIDGLHIDLLADKYIKRRAFFKKWTIFDIKKCGGFASREICEKQWDYQEECLSRLTDLILESKATKKIDGNGNEVVIDKNMQFIRDITCERRAHRVGSYLDILNALFEDDYTIPPRNKGHKSKLLKRERIAIIQSHVYAMEARNPLFKGSYKQEVNISLLLHTINFFKFHFKAGSGEGLLSDTYQALASDQYPQAWLGHIKPGTQELGSHWKGTYTWLDHHELEKLRTCKSDGDIFSDSADDESLVDMRLFFDVDRFPIRYWPPGFDDILDTNPFSRIDQVVAGNRFSPRKKREQKSKRPEIKQFLGSSKGARDGYVFGRLHALNNQQEIHGWQRVTFLKFFADINGEYDANQVWAYEGVVLPGGRTIIGRWRDAMAGLTDPKTQLSGPFIFWNVDSTSIDSPIEAEEAMDFAKTIIDPRLSLLV